MDRTNTKQGLMCLAQGPQHSDAGEAQTHNPSVLSQALLHCMHEPLRSLIIFLQRFLYLLYMQAAMAQTSLRLCTASSEPQLLVYTK